MIATEKDYRSLVAGMEGETRNAYPLMMSRVCLTDRFGMKTALVGPMVGAPYAVILLENLIAWGARKILFFGWCGAIAPGVGIGDILLPTGAFIDEGASLHYDGNPSTPALPASSVFLATREILTEEGIPFQEGLVWTTDAVFRETPEKVVGFRDRGALAVEMESSALFTVGGFRKVDVGAILVVSDELSSLKWRPGFREERFQAGCRRVREMIPKICRRLGGTDDTR